MDPDDIMCLNCGHAWGWHSPHGSCCADNMGCQCPGQLLDADELRSLGKLTESMIRELSNPPLLKFTGAEFPRLGDTEYGKRKAEDALRREEEK